MASTLGTRRDDVLGAAARLFSERGYHGTSMQHLADKVGILRGSIYAHISSKEDLLFEIVDSGADRFISRLQDIVASDVAPEDKLRAAIEAHVLTVVDQMDAATVFLNDWRFLSGRRRKQIEQKRRTYDEMVSRVISEGIDSGNLRKDLDVKFATLLVLSAVNWLYQWYDAGGPSSPQDIARIYGDMIITGFGAKPPIGRKA